jgi:hypothetical protein
MINWLTLFKEIIAVYCKNHTKATNTVCGQNAGLLNVKAGGISASSVIMESTDIEKHCTKRTYSLN